MAKKKERLSLSDILSMYDNAAQEEEENIPPSNITQSEKVLEIATEEETPNPSSPPSAQETQSPQEAQAKANNFSEIDEILKETENAVDNAPETAESSSNSNTVEPGSDTVESSSNAVEPGSDTVEPSSNAVELASDTVETKSNTIEPKPEAPASLPSNIQIDNQSTIRNYPQDRSNESMQSNTDTQHLSSGEGIQGNCIISTPQNDYDISTPEGVNTLHQEMTETLSETEEIMSRIHNSWDAKVEIRTIYTELEKAAKLDASSAQIIKLGESIARLGDVVKVESPSQSELSRQVMKLENMRSILSRYIDFLLHCK